MTLTCLDAAPLDRPWWRQHDVGITYAAGILAAAAAARAIPPHRPRRVAFAASTNLGNLRRRPLFALVSSAFVMASGAEVAVMPPLAALVLGAAQRRHGRALTLAAAVSGHVGATLATTAILELGIRRGWFASREGRRIDVGASYALATVGGLVLGGLALEGTARAWPARAVAGLSAALLAALIGNRDLTDAGHLIAWAQGLLLASWAFRR